MQNPGRRDPGNWAPLYPSLSFHQFPAIPSRLVTTVSFDSFLDLLDMKSYVRVKFKNMKNLRTIIEIYPDV